MKRAPGAGIGYILQVPGLILNTQVPLVKTAQHREVIRASNIDKALQACERLEAKCTTDRKKEALRKTRNYLAELGALKEDGNPKVERLVSYLYSERLHPYEGGRRFAANGVGLQRCLRCVRAILCAGAHKCDLDIRAAHPTIAYELYKKAVANIEFLKLKVFPSIEQFLRDKSEILALITAAYKCSERHAKDFILARMNGCHIGGYLQRQELSGLLPQAVKTLFTEFDTLRDILAMTRPDLVSAATLAGAERPELTAFSYLLCEQEDRALQIMEETATGLGVRVDALCFDGIILDYENVGDFESVNKKFIHDSEARILSALGYRLSIVHKPWDTSEDVGVEDELMKDAEKVHEEVPLEAHATAGAETNELTVGSCLHLCVPKSIYALGIPIDLAKFRRGPYSYRYVMSKVPGLKLYPVRSLQTGECYLHHQPSPRMNHCSPLCVHGNNVLRIEDGSELPMPLFMTSSTTIHDVFFRVVYNPPPWGQPTLAAPHSDIPSEHHLQYHLDEMAGAYYNFPPAKRGVQRLKVKEHSMKTKKTPAYASTPYVRHNTKTVKSRGDRQNWAITLKKIWQLGESDMFRRAITDGILEDKEGSTCTKCCVGELGPLKHFKGRGLRYRCGRYGCQKLTLPHDDHPFFTLGSGSRQTPFADQCGVLFCSLAGCSNVATKRLTGVDHKIIEKQRVCLDREVAVFVEREQKAITFGDGKTWKDVEADEAVFGKVIDEEEPSNQQVEWNQWAGLVERGVPISLVLQPTTTTKTCTRAPGPGAIKKVDWSPLCHKYLKRRRVVLHTDRAKSYGLKVEGVVHDSVRHCRKRVKRNGKWVWMKPYFVKLVTHTTPDGTKVRCKSGTQIIDRVWQHVKKHTKYANCSNHRRLNVAIRCAQWTYWNEGGDLWPGCGQMLAANRDWRNCS